MKGSLWQAEGLDGHSSCPPGDRSPESRNSVQYSVWLARGREWGRKRDGRTDPGLPALYIRKEKGGGVHGTQVHTLGFPRRVLKSSQTQESQIETSGRPRECRDTWDTALQTSAFRPPFLPSSHGGPETVLGQLGKWRRFNSKLS